MSFHQSPAALCPPAGGLSTGVSIAPTVEAPVAPTHFPRSAFSGGFDGNPSVPTPAAGSAKTGDGSTRSLDWGGSKPSIPHAQAGEAVTIPITDTYITRPYTTWIPDRISMGCQLMGLLPVSLARLSIQGSR